METPSPGLSAVAPKGEDLEYLRRVQEFFREVMAELKKVNWPGRSAIINSTAVVLVVTVVIAFFLAAVDVGLARVVGLVLR